MNINDLIGRSRVKRMPGRTPVRRGEFIVRRRADTFGPMTSRLASLAQTAIVRRMPGRTAIPTRLSSSRSIIPGAVPIRGIMPSVPVTPYVIPRPQTAAASGGGLPALSPGASNLGTQLGDFGSSLSAYTGEIGNKAKELLPIAAKIVGAVIIVKIVLWLMRGRR